MKIQYQGGTKFDVEMRGHKITVDLPPEKGGADSGMMPPELFVAALGTCIGVYVTQACQQLRVNAEGITIDMDWVTEPNPLRISKIHAKVHVPAGVPEDKKEALLHAADVCMIHQTLCNQPEMQIDLD